MRRFEKQESVGQRSKRKEQESHIFVFALTPRRRSVSGAGRAMIVSVVGERNTVGGSEDECLFACLGRIDHDMA